MVGGTGFDAISEPYGGFKLIVRGYDRNRKGVNFTPHTGCGFGNPLNAGCFDREGRLVELIEG